MSGEFGDLFSVASSIHTAGETATHSLAECLTAYFDRYPDESICGLLRMAKVGSQVLDAGAESVQSTGTSSNAPPSTAN